MNECKEGKIGSRSRIRFIFFISFPFVAREQSNVNRIFLNRRKVVYVYSKHVCECLNLNIERFYNRPKQIHQKQTLIHVETKVLIEKY